MFKILLILTMAFSANTFAQSGKVVDQNNEPIPSVIIQNITKNNIAETNTFGIFELENYSTGDTLKAFILGFETQIMTFEKEILFQLKEKSITLSEVSIRPDLDAVNVISKVNLAVNPVNSSQELLRYVPGLFIGQHAGGGKAEQIFLRGFDIDHGTDLSINVDDMPVNMVSHAHGQGYSDLHFIIPETVENIEFAKGSYKADKGNFTTAGSVDFRTKEYISENLAKVEFGQFNHKRFVGIVNLTKKTSPLNSYIASEYLLNDGPFLSPQNLKRFNVFFKNTLYLPRNQKLNFTASHFTSNWDASGQIPTRAVESGLISRFGAIDDTEGGQTARTNFQAKYFKQLSSSSFYEVNSFYTNYDFLLYSNFTFFANNPIDGDQIRQKESRNLFGINNSYHKSFNFGDIKGKLTSSAGFRNDLISNNELSRTKAKTEVLEQVYLGDINELNAFASLQGEFVKGRLSVIPGLRIDHFRFKYLDKLAEETIEQVQSKSMLSPKLNVIFQKSASTQFFLKTGLGYHSNDARGVIAQQAQDILPRSFGADLGTMFKPTSKVLVNLTSWFLYLQQEFVYVGDEGVVEPSGRTRRIGLDLSINSQITNKLFFNTDMTYTHARSIDEAKGENFIPLAPVFTMSTGLSLKDFHNFTFGLRSRYLGHRAANEDNSLVAKGYFVTDANVSYHWNSFNLGLEIQNLFNTEWNETQFSTTSQLRNEPQAIEEIHFTPGTPFNARMSLKYSF